MDNDFESVSISGILNALKRQYKIIIFITVGFLLVGILQAFVISEQKYMSQYEFEINSLEPDIIRRSDQGVVYDLLENMTKSSDMNFDQYGKEITSDVVLEKTISDLELEDQYTVSDLRSKIDVSSDPDLETVKVKISLGDSKQGGEILTTIEENFSEHITKIKQENSEDLLEVIQEQMLQEKEKYTTALEEYKEVTNGSKSSMELEEELEGVYEQITGYKANLNDLRIEEEAIEAALEEGDFSSSNILVAPSQGSGNFYIGTGKEALEVQRIETRSKIDSTEKTIEELRDSINRIQEEQQEVEFEAGTLRTRLEISKSSYEAFTEKYEELKMKTSLDIGGISVKVLPGSFIENQPVGTRKAITLTLFTILGLIVGVITSLFVDFRQIKKLKEKN